MKNKQHDHILRAFLDSKIPNYLREQCPQLIDIDSVIGGYCTQVIKDKNINIQTDRLISENECNAFEKLINTATGESRQQLVIYYRLVLLVEAILYQYG